MININTSDLNNRACILYLYDNKYLDSDYFNKVLFYYYSLGLIIFDFAYKEDIDKFFNNIKSNSVLK